MREWNDPSPGLTRRRFLESALALGTVGALGALARASLASEVASLPFDRGERPLMAFPQKRPLMVMTTRPPQLETPLAIFTDSVFTPNDAFFVRWHLAGIPTLIDPHAFRLKLHGHVKQPLTLSLDQLKRDFEQVEVAAVCQCAGNSRGFSQPRVSGGQWGHGAMGNALWRGVRLRDILNRAGLRSDAVQVRFNGLDRPVAAGTPDFQKSLDLHDALTPHVLLAYQMNGEPLPWLNGYPLRLVVPGWYATYWIKMLNEIEVLTASDRQFWMTKAYRLPANSCHCLRPGEKATDTVPVSLMNVRSFITNLHDGVNVPAGKPVVVKGIAFDQGHGIDRVLFSIDGGNRWEAATLGKDHGNYSFRPWQARFTPVRGRTYALQSRAINRANESQGSRPRWNPGGYLRNVVETVRVVGA